MKKIVDIKNPSFLKEMTYPELEKLSKDIRSFLIENVSKTGGHLSSNLGIVELTVAMHMVFDSPVDQFIFDVGHQSYVHKILTGRAAKFDRLRQFEGLSGFQNRLESKHDAWEAGHAGTALSAALGSAIARDLNHDKYSIVAVVGDGAMPNGESFEALNHIGSTKHKLIIILNDNNMSISANVGALSHAIARLRTSAPYNSLKHEMKVLLNRNVVGSTVLKGMRGIKDTIKKNVVKPSIFTDLNLEYLGPVNGHNYAELIDALTSAKDHEGPVLVHVMTTKGKGFTLSENDKSGRWHGVNQFDPDTGNNLGELPINHMSWSQIISETLVRFAKTMPDLVVLTPAMIQGSKLDKFFALYPQRSIDCGIAEEHATTLAASLALNGKKPFLSIYSTFLQRSYDQINHDIARMKCPVVIGIDRSGLVGEDGPTHHGVFDIGLLRPIPNMIIAQAKDAEEAQNLLYTAFSSNQPFALRYPRGSVIYQELEQFDSLPIGSWTTLGDVEKADGYVISYGPDVDKIYEKVLANELNLAVINARFIKPLDTQVLDSLAQTNKFILCYETDMLAGGLGSSILEYYEQKKLHPSFSRIGIQDHFVPHGSMPELRKHEAIDLNSLFEELKHLMTHI